MLCFCSTPLSHDLPSTADLLNVRIYKTDLPAANYLQMESSCFKFSDRITRRCNMIKQHCSHLIRRYQKTLYVASVQLMVPGIRALFNIIQIAHISTLQPLKRVKHFKGTVVIIALLDSSFSSEEIKSLMKFQLRTLFRMQRITNSVEPALPLFPQEVLLVILLSHPTEYPSPALPLRKSNSRFKASDRVNLQTCDVNLHLNIFFFISKLSFVVISFVSPVTCWNNHQMSANKAYIKLPSTL